MALWWLYIFPVGKNLKIWRFKSYLTLKVKVNYPPPPPPPPQKKKKKKKPKKTKKKKKKQQTNKKQ